MTTPYSGYTGQVWLTAYRSLSWLSSTMAAADNQPSAIAAPVSAVYQTLRNAVDVVSAYATLQAWNQEIKNLQSIQVLPLNLDTTTAQYFNNRITAYTNAAAALANIIPIVSPTRAANLLAQGVPAIPDPCLLAFYASMIQENPPTDLSYPASIALYAANEATAWMTIAQAVNVVQGSLTTQAYDTAIRQYEVAQFVANRIANFVSPSPQGSLVYIYDSDGFLVVDGSGNPIYTYGNVASVWNALVAMPSLLLDAAILSTAPFSNANQQSGVIRYTLLSAADTLSLLLLSLRQPAIGVTNVATLLNNDSLLDFAARNTGDFENWVGIANANSLLPPWTGTGGAAYGSSLFIPSPGSQPPTPGVAVPTYAANVIGTDIYLGPINGVMPPWKGDYQSITGYNNLAISCGRRLQTTLGTLIYHSDFGSRIPPEVGNVQDSTTAGHIASYGQSALLSDPRVGEVLSPTATILPNGLGLVQFTATVVPIGRPSDARFLDETISTLA